MQETVMNLRQIFDANFWCISGRVSGTSFLSVCRRHNSVALCRMQVSIDVADRQTDRQTNRQMSSSLKTPYPLRAAGLDSLTARKYFKQEAKLSLG